MDDNNKPQRDENGDIIFPKDDYDFAGELRQSMRTHVFHFKDSDGYFLKVDYDKYDFPDMRTDLPKFSLKHYHLFEHEQPATDEWFKKMNNCNNCFSDFFSDIFKNRMPYGITSHIDKYDLVLPVEKFDAINSFITDSGLDSYRDFIFYLTAKIEELYIEDIEYEERPEQKKLIKNFPKEVNKLYDVLKRTERINDFNDQVLPPQLQKISFQYNKGGSIKIENPLLLSSITKGTIEHFSEGIQKNWEKQLKGFPNVYDSNQLPNEFRHRICKSLHNFFRHINTFNYSKAAIPEKELDAIAKILDFAWVKFHDKKGNDFDIKIDLLEIKKNIRLAITRKEMISYPTHLTAQEIKPDFEKLKKYFDANFLMSGMQSYDLNDMRSIGAIISRFDLAPIGKELLHIYDCLKQRRFQIGHQFESLINKEIENNEDYRSWKNLFKILSSKNSIKKVTFSRIGESEELNFNEELSVELIRQALCEFYKKNKFEFDNDFYESQIHLFKPHGSFQLITTGQLNKPANRFFSKITKQLYKYLLDEVPPTDKDWKPSEKYFTIIAMLLMSVFEIGDPLYDEDFAVRKVKEWYSVN